MAPSGARTARTWLFVRAKRSAGRNGEVHEYLQIVRSYREGGRVRQQVLGKQLVGNKGFARFLRIQKGSVSLDGEAVVADAQLDGLFVLTTSTDLPAAEVARTYKSLWRVERTFREEKSTLEVRPIFHHSDRNSVGHIVGSFLALRLEVDLQRRLDAQGVHAPWPDLLRDLAQVQAVTVDLDDQRYRLRTDFTGHAHAAFLAAGVRVPSALTALGAIPPPAPEPQVEAAV